ncbi:hypothetical protein CC86DRAFT_152799 [Ophiobolus disseminans]|uniref:Uncharacterized protein n=1 Tax=Ophiobolus disseminans TaxID=1469910 RepID=A0A6A6ZE28_9PLEO|nr:hypothetical protein CC86DRAFT_152799 [Ophiobolus disseminans]
MEKTYRRERPSSPSPSIRSEDLGATVHEDSFASSVDSAGNGSSWGLKEQCLGSIAGDDDAAGIAWAESDVKPTVCDDDLELGRLESPHTVDELGPADRVVDETILDELAWAESDVQPTVYDDDLELGRLESPHTVDELGPADRVVDEAILDELAWAVVG